MEKGSLIFRVLAHPLLREFSFHFARPPTLVISFRVTFVLRSSLPLPRSFPFDSQDTRVLRNGVSRTDTPIAIKLSNRRTIRNDRRLDAISERTLDESFYAGSALIRRRSDVRRVGTLRTLRASCFADRTRLLGNERTTSSKTRLFENQISPRRPDRREISKIVRGSFDRACENNAAIGNERRYRRRYR